MTTRTKRFTTFLGATLALLLAWALPAAASEDALHQQSDNYRVYLGVVPASALKRSPTLVDGDKSLHGGADSQAAGAQHVMVAVYDRKGSERIKNATVIATVSEDRFVGGQKVTRPLEKMQTSGVITYGNFFALSKPGKYRIDISIYGPDSDGPEDVRFEYARP